MVELTPGLWQELQSPLSNLTSGAPTPPPPEGGNETVFLAYISQEAKHMPRPRRRLSLCCGRTRPPTWPFESSLQSQLQATPEAVAAGPGWEEEEGLRAILLCKKTEKTASASFPAPRRLLQLFLAHSEQRVLCPLTSPFLYPLHLLFFPFLFSDATDLLEKLGPVTC